jgi:hypothetical protein
LERKPPTELEEYRERFRHAPSGTWQTAQGTFDAVASDTISFLPDHTGVIEHRSSFSGATTVRFQWREKAERTIEIRYLDHDDDTDADDEPWDEIRYDFKPLNTDTPSRAIVLHELDQEGFWNLNAPLRLISPE